MRYYPGSSTGVHTDWPRLVGEALSTFGTRFGRAGVYAGYANLVDRQLEDHAFFMQGRVLAYSLTAWVPHVVYPDKPVHPFRDIGYLIRDNFSSRFDTVYAPTLVGFAFADFGLASVVTYLFFGGLVLGCSARFAGEGDGADPAAGGLPPLDAHRGGHQPHPQRLSGLHRELAVHVPSAGLAAVYVIAAPRAGRRGGGPSVRAVPTAGAGDG